MTETSCRSCNDLVHVDAVYCPHCGTSRPSRKPGLDLRRAIVMTSLVLLAVGSLVAYDFGGGDDQNVAEVEEASVEVPPFSVISDISVGTFKRTLEIQLEAEATGDQLEALAHEIRRDGYERTYILYFLPGMQVGSAAWATTHFNPELEIHIQGEAVE